MEYPYFNSIAKSLKSVKRPGFFATGGVCNMPLPSLSLANAPDDVLGLPVSDSQTQLIIASATQAPFGRGEDTIVDTSVRRTWQLSPTQFTINNSQWEKQMRGLLDQVKGELGCDPNMTVTGELYKLLLYEPGGFFKRHRDTEKAEGMFGTLVFQLPSNYTGGKLAVYHQSKSKNFEFDGSVGCNNFHYAAFYADCQHEIQPVTKGYRLCLVYNLLYQGSGGCPAPADHQEIVSSVISSMKEWGENYNEEDGPPLMTYMLEHKYCDVSLSFQLLKNSDRAVADVLSQVKKEVEFDLYIAKVSLVENWSASHDCCYRRYCHDSCGNYIAEDLCDETVSAENLISFEGHQRFNSISIDKEYFVPEAFFDSRDPDEEEFEEATGNEGATVDRQYNWAALLIWPSQNRIKNLGFKHMVQMLNSDLQGQPISQERAAELSVVAKDLIRECASRQAFIESSSLVPLLQSLQYLGKVELAVEFLDYIASSSFCKSLVGNSSFGKEVAAIGLKFGWDLLRSPLQAIFDKLSSQEVGEYIYFLNIISQPLSSEVQKDLCGGLACVVVTMLSNEEDSRPATPPLWYQLSKPRRTNWLVILFQCLVELQCEEQLLPTLIMTFRAKPKLYSVLDALLPVCDTLYKSLRDSKSFKQLLSFCISSLKETSSRAVPCPKDWSQPATFSCSCKDCQELTCFLKNPMEKQHRFKVVKGRRYHLHCQIDSKKCSVTHVTERIGSPHTLVVTKTQSAYEKECKVVQKEKASLSRLLAMEATVTNAKVVESGPSVKRQKVDE